MVERIPKDLIKAGRRVYDKLGRGSVSDSEHIAAALYAERKRTAEEVLDLLTCHELLYRYRPKAFDGFIQHVRTAILASKGGGE